MNIRRFGSRKVLLASVVGVTVFGGTYGLAASLGLTTDTLGAAQTVVAACQAGTMNVTYTPSYSSALPGYNVTAMTVAGLQAGCYSKSYRVTVSGAAGASLAEVTGTAPTSGTTIALTVTASAASITGVAVVFEG
jgi:hypothetical protein